MSWRAWSKGVGELGRALQSLGQGIEIGVVVRAWVWEGVFVGQQVGEAVQKPGERRAAEAMRSKGLVKSLSGENSYRSSFISGRADMPPWLVGLVQPRRLPLRQAQFFRPALMPAVISC